jgi:quercetin dioxygenase-like cupin family protein
VPPDEPVAPSDEPVVRTVLMDVRLPATRPTDHVEIRRITMRPGVAAGPHVHNGPVVGHILAGSVVFQVEGQDETVLRAGDPFYEPEGVTIAKFDAREDGVTFIGYFPLGAAEQPEISPR